MELKPLEECTSSQREFIGSTFPTPKGGVLTVVGCCGYYWYLGGYMLDLKFMVEIDTYEDCPVDQDLLVWTGDRFVVEYVTQEAEYGTFYPANGERFTHYLRLPKQKDVYEVLGE